MRRDSPRYGNFPKRRKSRESPWNRASPAFGKLWEHAGKCRVDLRQIVPTPYPDEASYHIYAILVTDRDKLLEYLAEHGIGCSVHYKDNTEYKLYSYAADTCPRASAASKKLLTLPMHMYLSNEDVFEVTEHIKRYFEEVLKNGI